MPKAVEMDLSDPALLNGTLAWDIRGNFDKSKCLDIDPKTIFEAGESVMDPLDIRPT